jgi:hypothetical protein
MTVSEAPPVIAESDSQRNIAITRINPEATMLTAHWGMGRTSILARGKIKPLAKNSISRANEECELELRTLALDRGDGDPSLRLKNGFVQDDSATGSKN